MLLKQSGGLRSGAYEGGSNRRVSFAERLDTITINNGKMPASRHF